MIIAGVAGRDLEKTKAYATKHGIPKVHNSYEGKIAEVRFFRTMILKNRLDLLADPTIDAIYNPLPNGLHFQWTMLALRAGKHVLVEKPSVSNGTEATKLWDFHASLKSKTSPAPVLLEAVHYRFHPAWSTFMSLIDSRIITTARSEISAPGGFVKAGDIRFRYDLSGGAVMDPGTYSISALRQVFGKEPEECISAEAVVMPEGGDQKVDLRMKGKWQFTDMGFGTFETDLDKRGCLGLPSVKLPMIEVRHRSTPFGDSEMKIGEMSHYVTKTVTFWNFILPTMWHRIDIVDEHETHNKDHKVMRKWTTRESKKAYGWEQGKDGKTKAGDELWSSYRYQLEEFVNRIKGREGSGIWIDGEDSVNQMKMIDQVYEKAGLPARPTSRFE